MSELIDIAARAGCTAVKHQWTSSAERLCERRNAPEYLDSYRKIEGSTLLLQGLCNLTRAAGLIPIVTAYLPEDIVPIAQAADAIKIASFEASDPKMVRIALSTGAPVYLSTGMMTVQEIYELPRVSMLFHCVSAYPASSEALHLRMLHRLPHGARIGFSDHSADVRTGALAVAAGAQALEVHYRHPATPPENPDYATALTEAQLTEYVANVRWAERAMGPDRPDRPFKEEAAMTRYRVVQEGTRTCRT